MSSGLSQRCALAMLAAMGLALALGLLAWGPIAVPAGDAGADAATRIGWREAVNALAAVPLALAALCGTAAIRRARWSGPVRRAWLGFFIATTVAAVLALAQALRPTGPGFTLLQAAHGVAALSLMLGVLAERVAPVFGERRAIGVALGATALGWVLAALGGSGAGDLRALLLLQLLPLLLVPAGALTLPGSAGSTRDWLVIFALFALARALQWGDEALWRATGWIGGQALMLPALAAVAGLLAYRAAASAGAASAARSPETHRIASATTSP